MSVNKYKPHVWVLPEDDANRELANGFLLHPRLKLTAIDVRPVARGWHKALAVVDDWAKELRTYPLRRLVLLVDLDGQGEARTQQIRDGFPADLRDRIYLLSTCEEPKALRVEQGQSLERLGKALADACAHQEEGLWNNPHLQHNETELVRLRDDVKPILFG